MATQDSKLDATVEAVVSPSAAVSEQASATELAALEYAARQAIDAIPAGDPSRASLVSDINGALMSARRAGGAGSALAELKACIARAENAKNDAGNKVAASQVYAAEMQLEYQVELAEIRKIKGFEAVNEDYFVGVSKLFKDMGLIERAYLAQIAETNPDVKSAIVLGTLASDDAKREVTNHYRQIRSALSVLKDSDQFTCEQKDLLANVHDESNFIRILPGNQTRFLELVDAIENKTATEAMRSELITLVSESRSAGLENAQEETMRAWKEHPNFNNYHIRGEVPEHLARFVSANATAEDTIYLVKEGRRGANEVLQPIADAHGISLSTLQQRYMAGEITLSEEHARQMDVRILARSVQVTIKMEHMGEVLRKDPHYAQDLLQNIHNQDKFVETMVQVAGNGGEAERAAFEELFIKSTPEEREAFVNAMRSNNMPRAKEVLAEVLGRCSDTTQAVIAGEESLDLSDTPSPSSEPKMCTMPPHVQAQVNAAGVLNLGQQPTNMSPVEVPSVIPGLPLIQANPSIVLPTSR